MSDKPDPSIPCAAYEKMLPAWHKIQTVLDGTESLRAAGETYLPRHENESTTTYDERLHRATLLNLTGLTLDAWVGRPFSDPVQPSEDFDEEALAWLDDIDFQGNNITTFARQWFREGLAKLYAHVLVDFPSVNKEGRTAQDDRAENLRPYMTFIPPENLIFASADMLDGREVLTHVRISETEIARVGFEEQTIERVRVFDRLLPGEMPIQLPGFADANSVDLSQGPPEEMDPSLTEPGVFVTVWRKKEDEQGREDEWYIEEPPQRIDIEEIPIVTFYAVPRDGLLCGKSPIEDLVDLNINWWQSNSDQNLILTVARFPILAATGVDLENETLEVGPKNAISLSAPEAKVFYVEHEGKAIEAGREHLQDLQSQMAEYGAEFLKKRSGDQTATARALDSAEATSSLQSAAMVFNDALNTALQLMATWTNRETVGTLAVSTEFGPEDIVAGDLESLKAARQNRDISRRTYLDELRRRGVLEDEFDYDENEKQLEDEAGEIDGAATTGDIDPFADDDTDEE